jgi:hypothetical protein
MDHFPTNEEHFDDTNDDKARIEAGEAVRCRICWTIFGRARITVRYCADCKRGFCEGEHGSFRTRGVCVRCFTDNNGWLKALK